MKDIIDFYGDSYSFEHEIAHGHMGRRSTNRQHRKHETHLAVLATGRNVCFKKDEAPAPAPDPAIGQAARMSAELGQKWLDFTKEQFVEGNKRQEVTDALTGKVINQQLDTQEQANTWAQEDRARTKNVFQPLEDQFIDTAKGYDSPEKQAEAAATAKADVAAATMAQQSATERSMASMGINPASGRFAGVTRANATSAALSSAGAQNNARQIVRDKAVALKADAINMGKGLPSSTAAAYGIGSNAGNAAVGNNQSANSNFYQNTGIMGQGYGGAMQGQANQANILNSLYGNQVSAWQAQQQSNAASSAGIGSMVGTIAGAGITAF